MKIPIAVLTLVVIVVAVFLVAYFSVSVGKEQFDGQEMEIAGEVKAAEPEMVEEAPKMPLDGEEAQKQAFREAGMEEPTDLLPADSEADTWAAKIDQTGLTPQYRSFIEAGEHVGTDTRGGVMKNANLQIRSDPPIPREDVGPWQNSTFQADPYRRQFEISE